MSRRAIMIAIGAACALVAMMCVACGVTGAIVGQGADVETSGPVALDPTSTGDTDVLIAESGSVGEAVYDGDLAFVVETVERVDAVGEYPIQVEATGTFWRIKVSVTNIGSSPTELIASSQVAYDAAGMTYSPDDATMIMMGDDGWITSLNPGLSVTTYLLFDVPLDVTLTGLVLCDGYGVDGAHVAL